MRRKLFRWISGAVLLGGAASALAHHSMAMFEFDKLVRYKGVVAKFDWANPHTYLYLDVEKDGLAVTLTGESGSPLALEKRGWSSTMLKPGERVTVEGNPSKAELNVFWIRKIITAGGKEFDAGSFPDNN